MDPFMHESCPEGKHLPYVDIPRAFSFAAYSQSVSLELLDRACDGRERVIGVVADQANCADNN